MTLSNVTPKQESVPNSLNAHEFLCRHLGPECKYCFGKIGISFRIRQWEEPPRSLANTSWKTPFCKMINCAAIYVDVLLTFGEG